MANQQTMAHHKENDTISIQTDSNTKEVLKKLRGETYGVPKSRRMLTPELLLKKHDHIRNYLARLGLTAGERDITFNLLRLYAYYGAVYPKAREYAETPGCSRRTFWRAIAILFNAGLIDVINRYLNHRQISNCYRLDKLVLCIIRYLYETGVRILDPFSRSLIKATANSFWSLIKQLRLRLRDPVPITT